MNDMSGVPRGGSQPGRRDEGRAPNRARRLLLAVLMLAGPVLSAEEIVVGFVDGAVELKETDSWVEIDIGDELPAESVLRLERGALVEFSTDRGTITISAPGTYVLADLLKDRGERKKLLGSFMKSALIRAVSDPEAVDSVSLGVRAAEVEEEVFEWLDEEEEILNEGKDLLADGFYEEAIEHFIEARELWGMEEEGAIAFYLGVAHAMQGETGRALRLMAGLDPEPWEEYYADWAVLTGQLLMEALDYRSAVEIFTGYLTAHPVGDRSQLVQYLSGLCYRETGDPEIAAERMRRAVRMDPDSELGSRIAEEEGIE